MISEQDLTAILDRANAATPGPWFSDGDSTVYDRAAGDVGAVLIADCHDYLEPLCDHHLETSDASFIAAARSDVPALVAEVRRLRAGIRDLATHDHAPLSCSTFEEWASEAEGWAP